MSIYYIDGEFIDPDKAVQSFNGRTISDMKIDNYLWGSKRICELN